MGIKTVPQPPYSPDVGPCYFWLFPKLRGCRYETIEEMKEAVTKVIDTFTQEDLQGAFQKLLERYNKCISAGGDYFERELEFHVCTINKSADTKKVWKLIGCTSYIYLNPCKQKIDVELWQLHSNTRNHLTVCQKKMSVGWFKHVINKMCLQIIYFNNLTATLEETWRQLHKNVESNIEQVLATTPHETPTVRSLTSHQENYTG